MKIFVCALLAAGGLIAHVHAETLPVLIIDGQNNHDWKSVTPVLKSELEDTGRFTVEVFTASSADDWKTNAPDFHRYRAVVLNYNGAAWPAPGPGWRRCSGCPNRTRGRPGCSRYR